MTLPYITLYYIKLHYITLYYIILRNITLHYIILHYIMLHYITLHYSTLHYNILHYIRLQVWRRMRRLRHGGDPIKQEPILAFNPILSAVSSLSCRDSNSKSDYTLL